MGLNKKRNKAFSKITRQYTDTLIYTNRLPSSAYAGVNNSIIVIIIMIIMFTLSTVHEYIYTTIISTINLKSRTQSLLPHSKYDDGSNISEVSLSPSNYVVSTSEWGRANSSEFFIYHFNKTKIWVLIGWWHSCI